MPRKRWTDAELAMLDRQICEVLAADHPQSVRHVFYRMTDPRLDAPVDKTDQGYKRVQRRCLELRRNGLVPYGWVSDSSRQGFHVSTFSDPGEFVEYMAGAYRATLWTLDLPHVEVWTESRSLAGILRNECWRLAVSLYPAGGFASETFCYEAAETINSEHRDQAVVLFVGDHDPAGMLIDRDIETKLREHLFTPLEFIRLGINRDQIETFNLPTKPRKAGERRRPDIQETVEAEAMPAGIMRQIVREAVESYLPEDALETTRVIEESERDGLKALGAHLSRHGLQDFMGPAS